MYLVVRDFRIHDRLTEPGIVSLGIGIGAVHLSRITPRSTPPDSVARSLTALHEYEDTRRSPYNMARHRQHSLPGKRKGCRRDVREDPWHAYSFCQQKVIQLMHS